MPYSLNQLDAFLATARTGSFSAAARHLSKAQSVVSTAVSNLEIDLGVPLFDRSGKYPCLTPEGEILLRDAEIILKRVRALEERALRFSDAEDARIRIAVDEIIPNALVVEQLARLAELFPATDVELLYGALSDIQTMVVEGRVDLGLLVPFSFPGKEVTVRFIGNMEFCLVVSPDHPLSKLNQITTADLESHRQIGITSRGGEQEPDALVFARQVWNIESNEAIRDLVLKGLGYASLPLHLISDDLKKKRLIRLPFHMESIQDQAPIYLIWASGRTFGKAGQWLINAFETI